MELVNETETTTQEAPIETPETAQQPAHTLFGSVQYRDEDAFEEFLNTMTVGHAVFLLIASANLAQARGVFNIKESAALDKAIRAIKKSSDQATAKEAEATDSPA
jgi:Holliday junction resolvasome RuvABC DNA-binding subunit